MDEIEAHKITDRQLQDALEKYERDKRARARASMMHDG